MASRCELVYGKSGSGKTTWWMRIAEEIYRASGGKLKTRLYLGDGGLETVEAAGLIEEGIVEYCPFTLWNHPFETFQFITEGYWPEDPTNPKSKWVKPDYAKLAQSYGMFVFEGLSVGADYLMGDREGGLAERMSKGESLNNDESFKFTDGSIKVGGNARTHYSTTQRRILHYVETSKVLPGWVQWTAHERQAQDYDTKEIEFGPDVAGKALTTKIGASFGNSVHLHPVTKKTKAKDPVSGKEVEKIEISYRAYTRKHYDPDNNTYIRYYANNRMAYTQTKDMPEFLEPPDPMKFYAILAEGKRKHKELQAKKMELTNS